MSITLTPIKKGDEAFLFRLYSETRAEEFALFPWDDAQKSTFLDNQFQSQTQHYKKKHPTASFRIIYWNDKAAERLYTAELDDEIRILDITILSEFRGNNIGTILIEKILLDGSEKGSL